MWDRTTAWNHGSRLRPRARSLHEPFPVTKLDSRHWLAFTVNANGPVAEPDAATLIV